MKMKIESNILDSLRSIIKTSRDAHGSECGACIDCWMSVVLLGIERYNGCDEVHILRTFRRPCAIKEL